MLFTDGPVERRGQHLDTNLDLRADQVAGAADAGGEQLADSLLATRGAGEDDVALLVVDVRPGVAGG